MSTAPQLQSPGARFAPILLTAAACFSLGAWMGWTDARLERTTHLARKASDCHVKGGVYLLTVGIDADTVVQRGRCAYGPGSSAKGTK
jgi:hypothetical protein